MFVVSSWLLGCSIGVNKIVDGLLTDDVDGCKAGRG